ncbi:uncharacterized protein AB675_546 [Cyphellophora attinorum]|uniref:Heterokaryon incompatibility domain-containing protein n=1 Tax=Cyphellophora attinorum TaxID=1664694 RepID=A0A0N0NS08_9EURO|nr:uncharacterized protein AB675_546 [Phialophora attinorum]KPI45708.1 hypothetical protein AB675_546 [Phialophora attinorum]
MNLDHIFEHPEELSTDGTPIADVPGFQTPEDAACGLCRLFTALQFESQADGVVRSGWFSSGAHLRAFTCLTKRGLSPTRARLSQNPNIVLSIWPGSGAEDYSWDGIFRTLLSNSVVTRRKLREPDTYSPWTFTARLIKPKVDYDLLREWIHLCRSHHTFNCEFNTAQRVSGLKVIDCDARKIVRLPHGRDYVALSYVWGQTVGSKPEHNHQSNAAGTANALPALVEDAISVVKNLGLNYLWVDKYCIDQSNPDELAHVVAQMDKVYEQATFTIAAASSESADQGLPGVSNIAREVQPAALVGDNVYISSLPELSTALESCKWMTRGWTYQEFILSRRCLVFTKLQVYFVCREGSRCEAVQGTLSAVPGTAEDKTIISTQFLGNNADVSPGWNAVVGQYTARALTYEQDSLNACRGVLARSTYRTYWGVPIIQELRSDAVQMAVDVETGLALGLCWRGPNDWSPSYDRGHAHWLEPKWTLFDKVSPWFGRRVGFPSWSWAGWSGTAVFPLLARSLDWRLIDGDKPAFWLEGQDDGKPQTSFEIAFHDTQHSKIMPETSPYLWLNATVVRCRIGCKPPGFEILHPDPDITRKFEINWAAVEICKGLWQDPAFQERLKAEIWDGILLFTIQYEIQDYQRHCIMLIDQKDDHYERIGIAWLKAIDLPDLPTSRKWIRLG